MYMSRSMLESGQFFNSYFIKNNNIDFFLLRLFALYLFMNCSIDFLTFGKRIL